MPSSFTYPGVYIEEMQSEVRTIKGVETSITAFIGCSHRGPVNKPVRVQSFAEFTQHYGGLWTKSTMSYAVNHFFLNGGCDALIVRVFKGDISQSTATLTLSTDSSNLILEAASPGLWGSTLRVKCDHLTNDKYDTLLFNLTIEELGTPKGIHVLASESFRNVSVDPRSSRFVDTVLKKESALVKVHSSAPTNERPIEGTVTSEGDHNDDDSAITDTEIKGDEAIRTGIYALESADLFNLLCIPPLERDVDVDNSTWAVAARYCQRRRAMLIVDSPMAWISSADTTISFAKVGVNTLRARDIGNEAASNVTVYFPRLRMADPLNENRLADFAPCGAVAGIISRTDAHHGVWKAPAGFEASFSEVIGFTYTMTDVQNGILNSEGINCLRSFPVARNVVWGARTLTGTDLLSSEWKYLSVRRLALFLEESLFRGTQWVVFEPNDERLWAHIRLNVGAFMHDLFRQSVFRGTSSSEAYFVECDQKTTTLDDINNGIVNFMVGFAPLKPAEFVVFMIRQKDVGVAA